ncbi:hypothetical protein GOP47_0022383 [Adiantum capillus-veneris]|uniref:Uncharacterized protein n=1 Tax=Adiantum capillus-veneris TaxID=13818 RepID=A0A9D4U7A8_ADICA|nr:hypothetical protein GOP47_0022383 [Adiantum capillus-veneris]
MSSLGNFLVSEFLPNGERIGVSEEEEKQWDASFWGAINREFEMELSLSQIWTHLKGQKLVVLDGNHRLKAWMSQINTVCRDDPSKCVRVKCTMTYFSPDEEYSMLWTLECLNSLTQTHVKRSLASDIFLIRRLGLGNEQSWKKFFDEEALQEIEVEIQEDKRVHPWIWWKNPLGLLMQLMYSGEFKEQLSKRLAESSLSCEDQGYNEKYKSSIYEVETYLKNKYGHNVTLDKLLTITQTPLIAQRKVWILDRILSKDIGRLWGFDGGEKEWCNYIAYYSYWESVVERAMDLIKEVKEVPFDIWSDIIRDFFDSCQKEHLPHCFREISKLTPGMKVQKMPYLEATARRFAYRQVCLVSLIPHRIEDSHV